MIRILDRHIADKIAAGEVIERPLSIVKELVENSVDAGATDITVEIRNGGKSYIRITDNGSGIDESDVEIAFERHATGKIRALEDLDRIMTLGFRGEALASIAAISRVTLYTKTEHSITGTRLELHAGKVVSKDKTGINTGTTLIVEDVFYNVPARRKFMKSDAREASAIIELIQELAIYYSGIRFKLINNGKIVLNTLGDGNYLNTIMTIYPGKEFKNLIEISGKNIHGFISPPGTTKSNRSGQLFFLNGRIIKSDVIERGLKEGYGDRIFSGYPVAILFLSVPPESVDVNIHPSKREVKFLDSAEIIDSVASAIRKAIKTEEAIPGPVAREIKPVVEKTEQVGIREYLSEKNREELADKILKEEHIEYGNNKSDSELFQPAGSLKEYKKTGSVRDSVSSQNGNADEGSVRDFLSSQNSNTDNGSVRDFLSSQNNNTDNGSVRDFLGSQTQDNAGAAATYTASDKRMQSEPMGNDGISAPVRESDISSSSSSDMNEINIRISSRKEFDFDILTVVGYVFNAYIITAAGDNMYIFDQHAAHERILYERFITLYNSKSHNIQPILTPMTVDVTSDVYNSERKYLEILGRMGYDIEDFGNNTFIIKGIPEYMGINEALILANNIMEAKELHSAVNSTVIDKIIMNSCKSAVKFNDRLSMTEVDALLRQLRECVNPFSCPHGRPTFIKISKYDLERSFKRK